MRIVCCASRRQGIPCEPLVGRRSQLRMKPALGALVTIVVACSPSSGTSSALATPVASAAAATSSAPAPTEVATAPVDPLSSPTIDDRFAVSDGRELAMTCWGTESPTVVLVGGHPSDGIADFAGTQFARLLAAETRTCAYSRSGYRGSDPAPNEPRTADDVITDLRELLAAADVDGPLVLVGSSFGGMIVTYYAAKHPDDIVGVVLLDVPPPSASLTLEEIPELAWDHPANPEHVDVIPEFEGRFARERLPIKAPLTVVTATDGQSNLEEEAVWLEISPESTQVGLSGGHDIYIDDPAGTAAEVLKLVDAQP
jgi:pimeloyl-ACP methyl ester carboxylesterase